MTRIFDGLDQSSSRYGTLAERKALALTLVHKSTPDFKKAAIGFLKSGIRNAPDALLADCPLCGQRLGVADRYSRNRRFIWLEGSEHYVAAHDLFPIELIDIAMASVDRRGPA